MNKLVSTHVLQNIFLIVFLLEINIRSCISNIKSVLTQITFKSTNYIFKFKHETSNNLIDLTHLQYFVLNLTYLMAIT